ncbi:MAG: tetratricopeptide repeat protein [Pirellulales bacterium]
MRADGIRPTFLFLGSLWALVLCASPLAAQPGLNLSSDEDDPRTASEILAEAAEEAAREGDRVPAQAPPPPDDLEPMPAADQQPLPGDEPQPLAPMPLPQSAAEPSAPVDEGVLPAVDHEPVPAHTTPANAPADSEVGEPPAVKSEAPDETANFMGIAPGRTTRRELHELWGKPKEVERIPGGVRETFADEAFEFRRVTIVEDVVTTLGLKLTKPMPAPDLAARLDVALLEPVDVYDEEGRRLGQSYPERGMLLGFEPQSQPPRVSRIVIEQVNAAAFLARAEVRLDDRYADCLDDVRRALAMTPDNARAHYLACEVARRTADFNAAIKSAEKAIQLEPHELEYRLALAKILCATGDHRQAERHVRDVVEATSAGPLTQAAAHCRWGECLAGSPERDYKQAIKHHAEAIKLAQPLAKSRNMSVRLAAKQVLLDAYLGTAGDIGHGRWQQKSKVVPKWLNQSLSMADDLMHHENAAADTRLRVYEGALSALAGIAEPPDPTKWISGLNELGSTLIDRATDPTYKAHLAWRLGVALADATEIEAARGQADEATRLGNLALAYFAQGEAVGKRWPTHDYLRGWLCYRMGAINAVARDDHRQAVAWFHHAVPLLESPVPESAEVNLARHGETFVSMAVSYWELGQREEALRLTGQGLELMERAAVEGELEKSALAVPYGNLARMHEQLGNAEQAHKYEELATRAGALGPK